MSVELLYRFLLMCRVRNMRERLILEPKALSKEFDNQLPQLLARLAVPPRL